MHICVLLTVIGLQMVLLLLVMCYYFILDRAVVKRDSPHMSLAWSPFADGPNALYVFIIAWAVGFAWVIFFKRPQSLSSVFLRRSSLLDATVVAVFIPDSRGVELLVRDGMEWNVTKIFKTFHESFDGILSSLFSEPDHNEPGQVAYCPVSTDENQVRYFEFQMRRYNYDIETESFQPAELYITGTAMQLMKMHNGLTSADVKTREAIIGANIVNMGEVSFIRIMVKEFSRIFYVYQNFMTWSWLNYSYW